MTDGEPENLTRDAFAARRLKAADRFRAFLQQIADLGEQHDVLGRRRPRRPLAALSLLMALIAMKIANAMITKSNMSAGTCRT